MEMIHCVIVDDEQSGINILKKLVEDYSVDLHILATFLDPIQAIPFILEHRPQVVFSDIEMDDINGIKLKEMLSEYEGLLVYVTAHSKYAIDALKAQAFDYLLKPLKISEFIEVNNKIKAHFEKKKTVSETITIHTSNSIEIVKLKDVVMIKGDGSYSHIYLTDHRVVMSSKNIGSFDKSLDSSRFFRSHQSYIVNIKYIESISKVDGLELVLINDLSALLSKGKKNALLSQLNK